MTSPAAAFMTPTLRRKAMNAMVGVRTTMSATVWTQIE